MTIENIASNQDSSMYYSAAANSNELILQPYGSRGQAMRRAWEGLIVFEILLLILTILTTGLVMFFLLMIVNIAAPAFINPGITQGAMLLLGFLGAATIVFFTGKAAWVSGYTTFTFDLLRKQFGIHTVNILGRKAARKIPFDQIQEAQFREFEGEGISMTVCLVLKQSKVLGFNRQETIPLSTFSSDQGKTITNLTALKHQKELLSLVRKALGLPTQEIDAWLRDFRVPTEAELEQQKAQAVKEAGRRLGKVAKMIFSHGSAELEAARNKIREFPEDPEAWEDLALLLASQKNNSVDEVMQAYRRAEVLYRTQGDPENAATIAKTLKRLDNNSRSSLRHAKDENSS